MRKDEARVRVIAVAKVQEQDIVPRCGLRKEEGCGAGDGWRVSGGFEEGCGAGMRRVHVARRCVRTTEVRAHMCAWGIRVWLG